MAGRAFEYKGFAAVTDESLTVDDLFNIVMEFGQVNLKCMELLDDANTGAYGNPVPTEELITSKKGPFIIVSGHDLKDLKKYTLDLPCLHLSRLTFCRC